MIYWLELDPFVQVIGRKFRIDGRTDEFINLPVDGRRVYDFDTVFHKMRAWEFMCHRPMKSIRLFYWWNECKFCRITLHPVRQISQYHWTTFLSIFTTVQHHKCHLRGKLKK